MQRRPLLLPLLLFLLLAAFGVHPAGGTGHPVMPSPYPTITHAAGTNALTFAASLDRAGTVFYVVATQPNGLDGGGTTAPTPTEVFAGTLSGSGVATASGKLTFASANVERSAVIERLPDASVFDVYVATHTDADAAPSGTPSPTTTSALAAATIQDVTPPAFAASTPHAVGHGPTYLTIAIAANENATAHVMILTADGDPPESATAVVNGATPPGATLAYSGSVNATVGGLGVARAHNFSGDMSPGVEYVAYVALRDVAPTPNVAQSVAAVAMSTLACAACPAGKMPAGTVCDCVIPLVFTLDVNLSPAAFAAKKELFRSTIASQIGVNANQVAVLGTAPSATTQGLLTVEIRVVPTSASDANTAALVSAFLAGGVTLPDSLGGNPSVGSVVLNGEPDTKWMPTIRPHGRTIPITDDGHVPGSLWPNQAPSPSNAARFGWKIWFNDTECTGCRSECRLVLARHTSMSSGADLGGNWTSCASPYQYHGLPEGEHNFYVRGLGGDATPDASPLRFTWTIRFAPEVFFATPPAPFGSGASQTFSLTSNKDRARFEYVFNPGNTYPLEYTQLARGINNVTVTSVIGKNEFFARAIAEGFSSLGTARHAWIYDTWAPTTSITSNQLRNGSAVNKYSSVAFVAKGNDTDAYGNTPSGVGAILLRFTDATGSNFTSPLRDFTAVDGFSGNSARFTIDGMDNLTNGMYSLWVRARDNAGNVANLTTNATGPDRYYVLVTDQVPEAVTIGNATTMEDTLTPTTTIDDVSGLNVTQFAITTSYPNNRSALAVAYQVTDIKNGQVFYPDGVTEVRDGGYVDAANATAGLRFLPKKDAYSIPQEPPVDDTFSFVIRPSGSFDDTYLADSPVKAYVRVINTNDPPTLDVGHYFRMTGVYYHDRNTTVNFGDKIYSIIRLGFDDPEGWDHHSGLGVAIIHADSSRGTWQLSTDGAYNWTNWPAVITPERPFIIQARETDYVRYVPRDEPDLENLGPGGIPPQEIYSSASFTFRAWDNSTGHATGSDGMYVRVNASRAMDGSMVGGLTTNCTREELKTESNLCVNATWTFYNVTEFSTTGAVSLERATAVVEAYGLERLTYIRGNLRDTLLEKARVKAGRADCPPPFSVELSLEPADEDLALTCDGAMPTIDPPWTIQAYVRRDAWLSSQALFTGPGGHGVYLDASPATGKMGLVSRAVAAARASAFADFYGAENNTAMEDAATRLTRAESLIKTFSFSAPIRQWVHLTLVAVPDGLPYVDGYASTRLYVDGKYEEEIPLSGMPLPIGVIGGPNRSAFGIDEVKFWRVAKTPAEIWLEKDEYPGGYEPDLVSYLPLEEGCGNTTADRADAAKTAGRGVWRLNKPNGDWYPARGTRYPTVDPTFKCAKLAAVFPSVVPPQGGTIVTLYGSGFERPGPPLALHLNATPGPVLENHTNVAAECRFSYRGEDSPNVTRWTRAFVKSDDVVMCEVPPALDARRDNVSDVEWYPSGASTVEFCNPAFGCCSAPSSLSAPHVKRMSPANYTPPSAFADPSDHAAITYRTAVATSMSPSHAGARSGALLTIRGRGFVSGDGAEPGTRGSGRAFNRGGAGVEGDAGGEVGQSGETYCRFTVFGGGAPGVGGGMVDNTRQNAGSSSVTPAPPPPPPPPSASASLARETASKLSSTEAAEALRKAGRNRAPPPRGTGRLTTTATVVNGATVTCELPAFPAAFLPTGSRISAIVTVVLNGGSHEVRVPDVVLIAAPEAPGPNLALAPDSPFIRAPTALRDAGAAHGPTNRASAFPAISILGDAAGGASVVIVAPDPAVGPGAATRDPRDDASGGGGGGRRAATPTRAFPDRWGGADDVVYGATLADGNHTWFTLGGFLDAACAFGTIRPVHARPFGARAAECIAPAKPRDGGGGVPFAATLFASAARYERVAAPALSPGTETETDDFNTPSVTFEWTTPIELVAAVPGVLHVESPHFGVGRDGGGFLHAYGANLPSVAATATCQYAYNRTGAIASEFEDAEEEHLRGGPGFHASFVALNASARGGALAATARNETSAIRCAPPFRERGGFVAVSVDVDVRVARGLDGGGAIAVGAGGGSGRAISGASTLGGRGDAQALVMLRVDAEVWSLASAPGPNDGGWLLKLLGTGFLPGDGCSLRPQGSAEKYAAGAHAGMSFGGGVVGRVVAGSVRGGATAGAFVSSALVLCEAPSMRASKRYDAPRDGDDAVRGPPPRGDAASSMDFFGRESADYDAIVRLAVPGGPDGAGLVVGGGGGFGVALTRAVGDVSLVRSALLPSGGGLSLTLAAMNLTAPIGLGDGVNATGGACRLRAIDVASRPAIPDAAYPALASQTVECISPATDGWRVTDRDRGVSIALIADAAIAGFVGAGTTPRDGDVLFAPRGIERGLVAHATGAPAPATGTRARGIELAGAYLSTTQDNASSSIIAVALSGDAAGTTAGAGAAPRLACYVPNAAGVASLSVVATARSAAARANVSTFECAVPHAPYDAVDGAAGAGFTVISVGVSHRGDVGDVTDVSKAFLSIAFEYAPPPTPLRVVLNGAHVPARAVDATAAFLAAFASRGGFFTATTRLALTARTAATDQAPGRAGKGAGRPVADERLSAANDGLGDFGAFYLTLVPIRPRRRGERRSLRTLLPGASLRSSPLAFNPRPRRLSTPVN